MAETHLPDVPPKPKRKYTKHKKAKAPIVKPEPVRYGAPQALVQIDRQLTEAIASLPGLNTAVSNRDAEAAQARDRLARTEQYIQQLVQLQHQIDGAAPTTFPQNHRVANIPTPAYTLGEIPPSIGSIPAKHGPTAGQGNVADNISREGGFS